MLVTGLLAGAYRHQLLALMGKSWTLQVTDTLGKLLREGPAADVAREYFVHLFFCSFGDYLGYSSWAAPGVPCSVKTLFRGGVGGGRQTRSKQTGREKLLVFSAMG